MASEELQREIEDLRVEGWQLKEEQGENKAIMVRRKYGSLGAHVLVGLLTVWWTLGIGNALYAAYKYFGDSEKKVVRVNEDQ
jgi:hypothetical protein